MPTDQPGRLSAKALLVGLPLIAFLGVGLGSCDLSPATDPGELGTLFAVTPTAPNVLPVITSPAGAEGVLPLETITPTSQPPSSPLQLTSGGCCVLPFWGPDSAAVYFLDRPNGGEIGTYRVDLQGNPPMLVEPGAAVFSSDLHWSATLVGGVIEVQDRESGDTWKVPSRGRMVSFSPQADWVTWQIQSSNVANLDRRRWALSVGSLSTKETSSPLTVIGGGFIGWGLSESTLLFSGKQETGGESGLWQSALDGSDAELLFAAERIRSPQVSPMGGWVALTISFSGDQSKDGMWLVSTQGKQAFRVPQFGAYRWRGEGSLLVIPLDNGRSPIRLLQVDANDGQVTELKLAPHAIDAIANNTWEISPDGQWLVFQSANDANLWLIRLPGDVEGP